MSKEREDQDPEAAPLDDSGETLGVETLPGEKMGTGLTFSIAIYSIVWLTLPVLLVAVLMNSEGTEIGTTTWSLQVSGLIGLATGAVHGVASLCVHAGRKTLITSWRTFYFCRPFLGAGMAVVTCLLLISGVGGFALDAKAKPEAVLAWAALAGLYSQPALDKLKELFATIFGTRSGG